MDQVLLLMRNPRRAIPSYHTMRWELDYAMDWYSSYLRIPDTYRERPTVERWELWRDAKFHTEIEAWFFFYDFWMQGGFMEYQNETHTKCLNMEIECHPQEVVDFENLYTDAVTEDFLKIGSVLDASKNVDVISSQARECVLHNVFNRTNHQDLNMHQASRPYPELPEEYKFTLGQLDKIFNRTIELRDKYIEEPYSFKPHAGDFVNILNSYLSTNTPEYLETVDLFLEDFVAEVLGDTNCQTSVGTELMVCEYMINRLNHDIFSNGFFPDNFPYEDWLTVRKCVTILERNDFD